MPPCSPRSNRSRVTSSTNSGTPPVRSVTPSTTSFGSAWRAASSPTMSPHLMAIERRQRNRAVMRAHAPGRPKLGPGGDKNEQRRQRAAFGDAAQDIERGRIGPMQVFKRQHHRLDPRTGHHPVRSAPPVVGAAVPPASRSTRVPAAAECQGAGRATGHSPPGRA